MIISCSSVLRKDFLSIYVNPVSEILKQCLGNLSIAATIQWFPVHPTMSHCRYEAFNSTLRPHNIHSNRLAPSRDIAKSFSVMEQLKFICGGGSIPDGDSFRCVLCHISIS